jgi:hypothetical protein
MECPTAETPELVNKKPFPFARVHFTPWLSRRHLPPSEFTLVPTGSAVPRESTLGRQFFPEQTSTVPSWFKVADCGGDSVKHWVEFLGCAPLCVWSTQPMFFVNVCTWSSVVVTVTALVRVEPVLDGELEHAVSPNAPADSASSNNDRPGLRQSST